MKTTIDFPADLLHRAKIAAVQRKTTLEDIVLQGVDYIITHPIPTPDRETERKARAAMLIAALSRGRNTEPVGRLNRDEIYEDLNLGQDRGGIRVVNPIRTEA